MINHATWTPGTVALAEELLENGFAVVGIATLHKTKGGVLSRRNVSDEVGALLEKVARKGPKGRLLLRRNRREVLRAQLRQNSAAQGSAD